MNSSFAAVTFVGPGEVERERLVDLVDSLLFYEPALPYLVIIDDASGHDLPRLLSLPPTCRLVVLENPRRGRGDWWRGGLCVALATAFQWIARNTKVAFAVRLDTDALVIAPFAQRIVRQFAADDSVGLLGTYKYDPQGELLNRLQTRMQMDHWVPKLMRPLTLWRDTGFPKRVQCHVLPRHRLAGKLARLALDGGYESGEFIQGGGYAISGRVLRRIDSDGLLRDPLAYLPMHFSEDHLATLFCFAAHLVPQDFNRAGDVFGVTYIDLFTTPEELLAREYAIIHSVKSSIPGREQTAREFFAAQRQSARSTGQRRVASPATLS